MSAIDNPATTRQLSLLKEHGYEPDHELSRDEAVDLIRRICEHPAPQSVQGALGFQTTGGGPFHFRCQVEQAQRALAAAPAYAAADAERALAAAREERVEFWLDTCRETMETHMGSIAARDLYRQHGCLFCTPTARQVEDMLLALDTAMPSWDQDHPELFYQTLRINFGELVKRV